MTRYFFDTIIGNPPYNENFTTGGNKRYARPLYHHFMDAAISVGKQVELITPARFLFDAGSTPKEWNHHMLEDPHLNILDYYPLSMKVFPRIDIKSGISIISYDHEKENADGPIKMFIPEPLLKSAYQKIACKTGESLSSIVSPRASYHLSELALSEHPEIKRIMAKHTEHVVGSNSFSKLENIIYFETKPDDTHEYVRLLGLLNGKRTYRWIRLDYLRPPKSFLQWKVFLPKANGHGSLGETLSTPLIGKPLIGTPLIGTTDTFLSIGGFSTQEEAENCLKYIKTKFARVLLGILKVTQSNTRDKWRYVPLQDFTSKSPIHWKESISHIDQQLYTYYGLTEDEQQWIEKSVTSMEEKGESSGER